MDIILKSVIGSILIALVLLAARYVNVQLAGVITAIPLVFLTSFMFGVEKADGGAVQDYLWNVFVSAVITALFIGLFFGLNSLFPKHLGVNLFISIVIYSSLIYILISQIKSA